MDRGHNSIVLCMQQYTLHGIVFRFAQSLSAHCGNSSTSMIMSLFKRFSQVQVAEKLHLPCLWPGKRAEIEALKLPVVRREAQVEAAALSRQAEPLLLSERHHVLRVEVDVLPRSRDYRVVRGPHWKMPWGPGLMKPYLDVRAVWGAMKSL